MKTRSKIEGPFRTEAEILKLRCDKFCWKTNGEIDRIAELFDDLR